MILPAQPNCGSERVHYPQGGTPVTDAKPTMSKQEANYTDGPVAIRPCKWCGSYIFALIMLMKGICTLV